MSFVSGGIRDETGNVGKDEEDEDEDEETPEKAE